GAFGLLVHEVRRVDREDLGRAVAAVVAGGDRRDGVAHQVPAGAAVAAAAGAFGLLVEGVRRVDREDLGVEAVAAGRGCGDRKDRIADAVPAVIVVAADAFGLLV